MSAAVEPLQDQAQPRLLEFSTDAGKRASHYLFRYPAKFHPPVARELVERFTRPGQTVLDPFCGSGTLLVEAAMLGRRAIGIDVDPVAVFVSRAKTALVDLTELEDVTERLLKRLDKYHRPASDYDRLKFDDLSTRKFDTELQRHRARIPAIPNVKHWFRNYVLIDLANIRAAINRSRCSDTVKNLLLLSFAAIIRSASNADPVPVSGLEVTAHMRRLDADGRRIDPIALFGQRLRRCGKEIAEYLQHALGEPTVLQGDATQLRETWTQRVDAVITSPPYHNAVDYYRRHTLEMYWLNLVKDHADRRKLLPRYLGRAKVPYSHAFVATESLTTRIALRWHLKLQATSPERAAAFKHYMVGMRKTFEELATILPTQGPAVLVVGKSEWNGEKLPSTDLFCELADGLFYLDDSFSYPVKNRYMSYSRRNGADINREYVLVLRRSPTR